MKKINNMSMHREKLHKLNTKPTAAVVASKLSGEMDYQTIITPSIISLSSMVQAY